MAKKIKLESDLYQKLEKYAGAAGYSGTEEFIIHVLEKSVAELEENEDEENVKERLKGLGYLG